MYFEVFILLSSYYIVLLACNNFVYFARLVLQNGKHVNRDLIFIILMVLCVKDTFCGNRGKANFCLFISFIVLFSYLKPLLIPPMLSPLRKHCKYLSLAIVSLFLFFAKPVDNASTSLDPHAK